MVTQREADRLRATARTTTVRAFRPLSKVRLFTLIGGLTGTATGFFLTIWSSLIWSLVTGAKDPVSFPPFVIIAFELTILLGGLSTALAVLVLGRLPKLRPSVTYDPRFTLDRFGVAVACQPAQADAVTSVLSSATSRTPATRRPGSAT